ncbi:hypothetical protein T02_11828 [Trichinella nativa]|uniref:Uncharacterized protein n=1 Tax=Trichinella nativa TaxID=6335 RepID=A0A0V1KIB1_9BILA|nr:hypothetical protein T02_11828 [Trichinella nativa]
MNRPRCDNKQHWNSECCHTMDVSYKRGTFKKSWDTKKVRPAYIRERVVTPRTPDHV